jgi:hypothetical protein
MTKEEFKRLIDLGKTIRGRTFCFYKFKNEYYHNCPNDTCYGSEDDFETFWELVKSWEDLNKLKADN